MSRLEKNRKCREKKRAESIIRDRDESSNHASVWYQMGMSMFPGQ